MVNLSHATNSDMLWSTVGKLLTLSFANVLDERSIFGQIPLIRALLLKNSINIVLYSIWICFESKHNVANDTVTQAL